jgi:ATP-dependent DNA ligase
MDVVVTGYKPGENGFAGMVGAIEFGQYDSDGVLVGRGRCSGMTLDERHAVTANQEEYLGRVFEVKYMGLFPAHSGRPHGALRHPQFLRWRPDKDATETTIEEER